MAVTIAVAANEGVQRNDERAQRNADEVAQRNATKKADQAWDAKVSAKQAAEDANSLMDLRRQATLRLNREDERHLLGTSSAEGPSVEDSSSFKMAKDEYQEAHDKAAAGMLKAKDLSKREEQAATAALEARAAAAEARKATIALAAGSVLERKESTVASRTPRVVGGEEMEVRVVDRLPTVLEVSEAAGAVSLEWIAQAPGAKAWMFPPGAEVVLSGKPAKVVVTAVGPVLVLPARVEARGAPTIEETQGGSQADSALLENASLQSPSRRASLFHFPRAPPASDSVGVQTSPLPHEDGGAPLWGATGGHGGTLETGPGATAPGLGVLSYSREDALDAGWGDDDEKVHEGEGGAHEAGAHNRSALIFGEATPEGSSPRPSDSPWDEASLEQQLESPLEYLERSQEEASLDDSRSASSGFASPPPIPETPAPPDMPSPPLAPEPSESPAPPPLDDE